MYVRLTAKLADIMEGVDLSAYAEGDLIELPDRHAERLILGGWAERVTEETRIAHAPAWLSDIAADKPRRR